MYQLVQKHCNNNYFKIVKVRIELNISQKDLAKKIGIKESTLEEIEALAIVPRIDTLIKLCDALNLELILEIKDNKDYF